MKLIMFGTPQGTRLGIVTPGGVVPLEASDALAPAEFWPRVSVASHVCARRSKVQASSNASGKRTPAGAVRV